MKVVLEVFLQETGQTRALQSRQGHQRSRSSRELEAGCAVAGTVWLGEMLRVGGCWPGSKSLALRHVVCLEMSSCRYSGQAGDFNGHWGNLGQLEASFLIKQTDPTETPPRKPQDSGPFTGDPV